MKNSLIAAILALVTLTASSAFADNTGQWTKLDLKVPVHEFDNGLNLKLRLTPELVFTDDAGGLKQTVFRAGPTASLTSWFNLTINGVSSTTGTKQDVRPEVQPEFKVKFDNLSFNDRNRFSYRALDNAAGDRWQYANELKAVYSFSKTDYSAFAAYEGYVDLSQGEMNQHRALGGVGVDMSKDWHMDFGYMRRTSASGVHWVNDNFLYVLVANK